MKTSTRIGGMVRLSEVSCDHVRSRLVGESGGIKTLDSIILVESEGVSGQSSPICNMLRDPLLLCEVGRDLGRALSGEERAVVASVTGSELKAEEFGQDVGRDLGRDLGCTHNGVGSSITPVVTGPVNGLSDGSNTKLKGNEVGDDYQLGSNLAVWE